ncbi:MAG: hypothetical protein M1827_002802 [Pycnora praestabilis]|nr:MAG: hypothetical protein M1827_002802 [Pycnora praestabilis]
MTSLPPQSAASQRRQSHSPTSASQASEPQLTRSTSHAPSTTSEDSQTVYLNNPSSPQKESFTNQQQQQQQLTSQAVIQSSSTPADEPRKCWICFTDETEDTPLSSEWRSPCPCALTAHESCLLDWIADLEAPSSRKRINRSAKILCPQCKSEITVQRPRSYVIESVNAIERVAGRLVIPGALTVLGGCLWTGFLVYGINTVHVIFGSRDANRILGNGIFAVTNDLPITLMEGDPRALSRFLNPFGASAAGWSWRLGIGLPLIPLVLVMSRTTLADSVLPVLPILFFATQSSERERLDLSHWPPSAAMSLAVLPYLRGAYNELYERAFGERERKWIKEVQPRAGETGDDAGVAGEAQGANAQGNNIDDGDFELAIDVEVDIFEEVEDDDVNNDQNPQPAPQLPAEPPQPFFPQDEAQQLAPQAIPAPPVPAPPAAAVAAVPQRQENNILISTSHLADTILGALLFPTISAAMGSLLKLALPKSWTAAPPSSSWNPKGKGGAGSGLLQARWGRSIVGGCLFVVLKDAVVLYCRWKAAQGHRKRRVVDYKGGKKGRVGGGGECAH